MRQHLSLVVLIAAVLSVGCYRNLRPEPVTPRELIVLNDQSFFDDDAATNANNVQLYKNLVSFTTSGARAQSRTVLIHIGHGNGCVSLQACFSGSGPSGSTPIFETVITGAGYTVVEGKDDTAPLTAIARDVKVIFLMVPATVYSMNEVVALKSFLSDSGRVVFVGEMVNGPASDQIVFNDLMQKLGSAMRNVGGEIDCATGGTPHPFIPASSLRPHQVTTSLTGLRYACASEVQLGPSDQALMYNIAGTKVVGATARVWVRAH